MSNCVIKIENNAAGLPCPFAGHYIEDFDPDYGGTTERGRGYLHTTPDITKAREFVDITQALDFWKQVSPTVPVRDDGEPNRPLTAFTVSIETVTPPIDTEAEIRIEV